MNKKQKFIKIINWYKNLPKKDKNKSFDELYSKFINENKISKDFIEKIRNLHNGGCSIENY